MALTQEDIQHIAQLSRLHLDPTEIEKYRIQLDAIIQYVETLQEVDTTGVPELQHALNVRNVFREDIAESSDAECREAILENFSHRQGDLLEVQAVFNRE